MEIQISRLRYMGTYYPGYFVTSDKRLFRRLRSVHGSGKLKGRSKFKLLTLHRHSGGYERWYVRNSVFGKQRKGIIASRAVAESFSDPKEDWNGCVAAHGPGKKRSDGALGDCTRKTITANRRDRKRDGTDSTGHSMQPGKLRGKYQDIARDFRRFQNKSLLARLYQCSPNAIRYALKATAG